MLELDIRTGRTHQIRVHCQSMGHPLIDDPTYGNRGMRRQLTRISESMAQAVNPVDRQMLHAWRLGFIHPVSGKLMTLQAPMPEDMAVLIDRCREIAKG